MKLYSLQRTQVIPASRARVFAFFSRPENLALLTPRSLGFTILTPLPVEMNRGALMDYTIRVGGLPVHWTTFITRFDPPNRFVDVQLKGPYAFWHHTHDFSTVRGGTRMTDTVYYGLPGGILGGIIRELFVKRQLERIFEYREKRMKELFPGKEGVETSPQKLHERSRKQ